MRIPGITQLIERKLEISEVLNRRTDLSTFVVHMTRDHSATDTARRRLEQIIETETLKAGEPRGIAVGYAPNYPDPTPALNDEQQESQRVVCFTETPLEHMYSMFASIASRDNEFQPYGLAMTKMVARRAT